MGTGRGSPWTAGECFDDEEWALLPMCARDIKYGHLVYRAVILPGQVTFWRVINYGLRGFPWKGCVMDVTWVSGSGRLGERTSIMEWFVCFVRVELC